MKGQWKERKFASQTRFYSQRSINSMETLEAWAESERAVQLASCAES